MLEGNLSIQSLTTNDGINKVLPSWEELNTVYLHDSLPYFQAKYKDDISGMGAKLYGSRWNITGIPMLYSAENISLPYWKYWYTYRNLKYLQNTF